MDCFNCPNQWNCRQLDDVLQGKKKCPNNSIINQELKDKIYRNGGYMYKAISDILKNQL